MVVACRAEEGGSGHYLPGTTASVVDAFPGKSEALAVLNYYTFYDAKASGSRSLLLGGLLATEVSATVHADTLAGVYQTPWMLLDGGVAFGLAVPYVWLKVEGETRRLRPDAPPGPVVGIRDTTDGVGDLTLIPVMVGWTNVVPDLKLDARLGIYAPTGAYEAGRLANVGKNYWTFEPGLMASWVSTKTGTEASLFAAAGFNTANAATDYRSGTAIHLDATLAQHLPFAGGLVGVGANAFWYQQVTGDRGSGARLGDFEGRTVGIGPVLSFFGRIGQTTQFLAEIKWLPEMDVDRRLQGDFVWLKLGFAF